jgi:predicted transcriptional regulator
MKNRLLIFLFVLPLVVLTTGCFEILEKYHFNRNGSGTYTFVMDMSQMGALISMMKEMDMGDSTATDDTEQVEEDTKEDSPFGDMNDSMAETKEKLKGIEGISNLQEIEDEENYQFGFTFDFDDIKSLNKALSKVYELEEDVEFFTRTKKKIERTDNFDLAQKMREEINEEGDGEKEAGDMEAKMFKDVAFVTEYTFDKKVKRVSNENAEIMDKGKKVLIKQYLFQETDDDEGLANTFKF